MDEAKLFKIFLKEIKLFYIINIITPSQDQEEEEELSFYILYISTIIIIACKLVVCKDLDLINVTLAVSNS